MIVLIAVLRALKLTPLIAEGLVIICSSVEQGPIMSGHRGLGRNSILDRARNKWQCLNRDD